MIKISHLINSRFEKIFINKISIYLYYNHADSKYLTTSRIFEFQY